MYKILKRLEAKEKNFLILAFLIPLTVRTIPEILSWPYPIGFDTLIYINNILNNNFLEISLFKLFKSTQLFYVIADTLNIIIKDPILEMKILGPALFSLLCYIIYIYCRRVLGWGSWKSLFANIIASTYFVSLRISWEMYRQMLGTTLLFTTLIILRGKLNRKKIFAITLLSLSTVWAHELAAVLLFTLTIMHVIFSEKNFKEKAYLLLSIIPATIIFIYQLYNPVKGIIEVPSYPVYASNQLELFNYITGFLIYMFIPLLPLIIAGVSLSRKLDIFGWTIACIILTYWPTIFPEQSLPIWFRFTILLIYPIIFISTEGFERLLNSKKRFANKFNIGKTVALITLSINLLMSGFYITSLPENAFYYFGELNNYKAYIQTSMLQNSVSISDTPNVIAAIKWIDQNLDKGNTTLVLHEAIAYWAKIYIKDTKITTIVEPSLVSPLKESIENMFLQIAAQELAEGKQVYTIWWTNGKGWYRMPNLPEKFIEIKHFNIIAVYKYIP